MGHHTKRQSGPDSLRHAQQGDSERYDVTQYAYCKCRPFRQGDEMQQNVDSHSGGLCLHCIPVYTYRGGEVS